MEKIEEWSKETQFEGKKEDLMDVSMTMSKKVAVMTIPMDENFNGKKKRFRLPPTIFSWSECFDDDRSLHKV